MMRKLLFLIFVLVFSILKAENPSIFLTPTAVKEIQKSLGKYPAFDKSYAELKSIADKAILSEIIVPIPKDGGGGYTHEKHKNNYYEMNACGILFQISGNKKYAQFVESMLLKYADLYPTLGLHPEKKSEAQGKLFWQTLNDAVWLFHTANAYDCVYNFLTLEKKQVIENKLFKPMAEFLSNGNEANYSTFNRMHNHGTWSQAAVGMIGYAMHDKELTDKALYGSKKDGKTGFISQLNVLFSPDGYFTEGPYYQRYSLWPFIVFAQIIENHQPELKIFNYRDGILLKAVNTMLQLAYNGELFYLNDALEKTYKTQELVYAVNIAYKNNPAEKQLLDIAKQQNAFVVSGEGLFTAKAVSKAKTNPFEYKSMLLRDGANGNEGGVAVFRAGKGKAHSCLTFKATSHGLSHGHYDKLSIAMFDNGNEILTDYGAARFLNIEPKSGGGYTKENYSWAMQTIAHNTVTVDQKSNFNGNIKESSKFHSDIQYCDFSKPDFQIVCGTEENAYAGVRMIRTTAMIQIPDFEFPIIADIYKLNSDTAHTYDFPYYYIGQFVSADFKYQKNITELKTLGSKNGYQHLWLEASAKTTKANARFTWVNANRFYSITALTNANTELLLTRLGASDPNFNLRNETAFMLRQPNASNHTFATIIEPHGLYDLSKEITNGYQSNVDKLDLVQDNNDFTAIKLSARNGKTYLIVVVNKDFNIKMERKLNINNQTISFDGNYYFKQL